MDLWTIWGGLCLLALDLALLAAVVKLEQRRRYWRARYLRLSNMDPITFQMRHLRGKMAERVAKSIIAMSKDTTALDAHPIIDGPVVFRRPPPFAETREKG